MDRAGDHDHGGVVKRRAVKQLAKLAGKAGQPLSQDDWEAYFRLGAQPRNRAVKKMLRSLPSDPRCGYCGAPFSGFGGRLVRPFGFRPSRKNPSLCAACVESAPPGGLTTEVGVLFADLRGFTAMSERMSPAQSNAVLHRFYGHAASVLLPEALIDKLIGDEVMALYLPLIIAPGIDAITDDERRSVARVMIRHARELIATVTSDTAHGAQLQLGIGLDFGEAFVGNVGEERVRDFTAIGDVINTAARLQAAANSGEIIVSARVARYLDPPPGRLEQLTLKGKAEPVPAYRVS